MKPEKSCWVASVEEFIGIREWLFTKAKVIPKRKFTNDLQLIKKVIKATKQNNYSMTIYPEARFSLAGINEDIGTALGKLAKKCGVTLSTANKATVSEKVNAYWGIYGEYYTSIGISKETLTKIFTADAYRNQLLVHFYGEGGEEEISTATMYAYFKMHYIVFQAINGYFTYMDDNGNTVVHTPNEIEEIIWNKPGNNTDDPVNGSVEYYVNEGLFYGLCKDGTSLNENFIPLKNTKSEYNKIKIYTKYPKLINNEFTAADYYDEDDAKNTISSSLSLIGNGIKCGNDVLTDEKIFNGTWDDVEQCFIFSFKTEAITGVESDVKMSITTTGTRYISSNKTLFSLPVKPISETTILWKFNETIWN